MLAINNLAVQYYSMFYNNINLFFIGSLFLLPSKKCSLYIRCIGRELLTSVKHLFYTLKLEFCVPSEVSIFQRDFQTMLGIIIQRFLFYDYFVECCHYY